MKKYKGKILMSTLVILLIGTQIAFGSTSMDLLKSLNPYYTGNHDKNIVPEYKANADKLSKEFLSENEILSIVDKNQAKTETSSIKSVKLKKYKNHILEDDSSDNTYNYLVDPDRMVWVVITEFPDGIDTKAAYFDKATLITVYDAETGNLLKSKVTGNVKVQYNNNKGN